MAVDAEQHVVGRVGATTSQRVRAYMAALELALLVTAPTEVDGPSSGSQRSLVRWGGSLFFLELVSSCLHFATRSPARDTCPSDTRQNQGYASSTEGGSRSRSARPYCRRTLGGGRNGRRLEWVSCASVVGKCWVLKLPDSWGCAGSRNGARGRR